MASKGALPGYGSPTPPPRRGRSPLFWLFVVGLPLVVLIVCAAALVAADRTDSGSADRLPTAQSSSPTPRIPTDEEYHRLMREIIPSLAGRTDAQLDTIGTSSCSILAGEDGWLHLIKALTDAGMSGYDAGRVGPVVVARFCPEQAGKLPGS